MSDNGLHYILTSTLPGNDRVGVLFVSDADQPIMLGSDSSEWFLSKNITEDGPIKLTVTGYRSITVRDGEVCATNDPRHSRDWYLFPTLDKSTYYISADSDGKEVWTVAFGGHPIKITTYKQGNEHSYLFKFVPHHK